MTNNLSAVSFFPTCYPATYHYYLELESYVRSCIECHTAISDYVTRHFVRVPGRVVKDDEGSDLLKFVFDPTIDTEPCRGVHVSRCLDKSGLSVTWNAEFRARVFCCDLTGPAISTSEKVSETPAFPIMRLFGPPYGRNDDGTRCGLNTHAGTEWSNLNARTHSNYNNAHNTHVDVRRWTTMHPSHVVTASCERQHYMISGSWRDTRTLMMAWAPPKEETVRIIDERRTFIPQCAWLVMSQDQPLNMTIDKERRLHCNNPRGWLGVNQNMRWSLFSDDARLLALEVVRKAALFALQDENDSRERCVLVCPITENPLRAVIDTSLWRSIGFDLCADDRRWWRAYWRPKKLGKLLFHANIANCKTLVDKAGLPRTGSDTKIPLRLDQSPEHADATITLGSHVWCIPTTAMTPFSEYWKTYAAGRWQRSTPHREDVTFLMHGGTEDPRPVEMCLSCMEEEAALAVELVLHYVRLECVPPWYYEAGRWKNETLILNVIALAVYWIMPKLITYVSDVLLEPYRLWDCPAPVEATLRHRKIRKACFGLHNVVLAMDETAGTALFAAGKRHNEHQYRLTNRVKREARHLNVPEDEDEPQNPMLYSESIATPIVTTTIKKRPRDIEKHQSSSKRPRTMSNDKSISL